MLNFGGVTLQITEKKVLLVAIKYDKIWGDLPPEAAAEFAAAALVNDEFKAPDGTNWGESVDPNHRMHGTGIFTYMDG